MFKGLKGTKSRSSPPDGGANGSNNDKSGSGKDEDSPKKEKKSNETKEPTTTTKELNPSIETLANNNLGPVCLALVIECTLHGTMGLKKLRGRNVYDDNGSKSPILFFPIKLIDETDEWESSAVDFTNSVLFNSSKEAKITTDDVSLLNIAHVQMSREGNWVRRATFLVRIGGTGKRSSGVNVCCQQVTNLNWFKLEQLMNLPDRPGGTPIAAFTPGHRHPNHKVAQQVIDGRGKERPINVNVWGSEVQLYSKSLLLEAHKDYLSIQMFQEESLRESLDIYPTPPSNQADIEKLIDYEQMILSSGLRKNPESIILYEQFVNHTFPSLVMNYTSFIDYFTMIGWTGPGGQPSGQGRGSNEAAGRRRRKKLKKGGRGSSETGPMSPQRKVSATTNNEPIYEEKEPQKLMMKVSMSPMESYLLKVFNSFRVYNQPFVRFNEFLYGIAAYSNTTPHGGPPGAARTMYIFRYFDSDRDELLNLSEFSKFRSEIMSIKGKSDDHSNKSNNNNKLVNNNNNVLEEEVKKDYKAMKLPFGSNVDFNHFIDGIGSLKLRGSAILCRSPVPTIPVLLYDKDQSVKSIKKKAGKSSSNELMCRRHRSKSYSLESVECRINAYGDLIELFPVPKEVLATLSDEAKHESSEMFNSKTIQTKIIDLVYHIAQANDVIPRPASEKKKPKKREHLDWTDMPNEELDDHIKDIVVLLNKCKEYYSSQPFVVHVQSPVHVFGDIHGNLADLLIHENVFWRKGPLESSNFLFLGDYVDRGQYSLEVILYLLSLKMKCPSKFTLLRGNHETRSLQMSFTFKREVIEKLARKFVFDDGKKDEEGTDRSHQVAHDVWELINQVFDLLPIACIIDTRIFTAHGGIPYSYNEYLSLKKMSVSSKLPLPDPEHESAAVWQMLWNDPAEEADAAKMTDLTGSGSHGIGPKTMSSNGKKTSASFGGFLPNEKRGTAYLYTDTAVDTFLANQGHDHIIRAHEVIPLGYRFQMNGKVITIFSTSRYCDTDNKAAACFVNDGKIRIIRIDT